MILCFLLMPLLFAEQQVWVVSVSTSSIFWLSGIFHNTWNVTGCFLVPPLLSYSLDRYIEPSLSFHASYCFIFLIFMVLRNCRKISDADCAGYFFEMKFKAIVKKRRRSGLRRGLLAYIIGEISKSRCKNTILSYQKNHSNNINCAIIQYIFSR